MTPVTHCAKDQGEVCLPFGAFCTSLGMRGLRKALKMRGNGGWFILCKNMGEETGDGF